MQELKDQISDLQTQLADHDQNKIKIAELEKTITELEDELDVMDKNLAKMQKKEKKLQAQLNVKGPSGSSKFWFRHFSQRDEI